MYKIIPCVNGRLDLDYNKGYISAIDVGDGTYIVELPDDTEPRDSWKDATEQDWQKALAKVPPLIPPGDLTPEQRYAMLDPSRNTLDEYKKAKLELILYWRDNALSEGFASQTTGHSYYYGDIDQKQFLKTAALLNLNPNLAQISFKTKDAGWVTHTREQILGVINDAAAFELAQVQKQEQLESAVKAATTIDEVNAIVWE